MFEILSGVRRAKATELAGLTSITADVYDANGQRLGRRDLPLASLLSPKDEIDLRTRSVELIRFRRLQALLLAGVVLDAIEVRPGKTGVPLSQVRVLE